MRIRIKSEIIRSVCNRTFSVVPDSIESAERLHRTTERSLSHNKYLVARNYLASLRAV